MSNKRLLWTLAVGAVFTTGAGSSSVSAPDPAQTVDRPSHHTEDGFRNPGGLPGHGQAPPSVTLPFFLRRIVSSFSRRTANIVEKTPNDGEFLRQNALASVPTVTWVGHSTLLVQMGHTSFLTDPIWSQAASPLAVGPRRLADPGLSIDDLPPIDFVVVSHNHYDHMDLETLRTLAEKGTRFFVPLANGETLRAAGIDAVEELDWWQSRVVGEVQVYCVPARHWSRRGLFDQDRALWSGWVVIAKDRRFFFAGDTGFFDGFREIGTRLGPFDLAALPIGAYEPQAMMAPAHLSPEEAVGAAVALGARRSVAIHFGTFELSDEPIDEPPQRFQRASATAGRGDAVDWVLSIGETRVW